MNNKEFIASKIVRFKDFVDTEQNPIFIVTAKVIGQKNKKAVVSLTPYFFSDTEKEMNKEQKLVILKFLAEFAEKEQKTL